MVQSDQLATDIPNHSPNSRATGQQDDYDYQDDREEDLYQVDGTTDIQTPNDDADDNEDNELDNTTGKRQRKTYATANTIRKEMTKQRWADVLKKQQEKEKAKSHAEKHKDKIDNIHRPMPHKSKGKASHPHQIKRSQKGRRMMRTHDDNSALNDPQTDEGTQDDEILTGDNDIVPDDGEEPLGPDKIGLYTFLFEGQGNLPDLMGIDDDQLLAIQNDLRERLKVRDKERERAVARKLHELEQKHKFANAQFLKHFAQVSELLEPTVKEAQAKVKPADKMLMLLPLFDGEKPEKTKTHYERFNQYIKFQTKEGNIKDVTNEAIELFEHTLDKKALIWFQQHKAEFTDLPL